jgi:hypothetical protein
VFVAFRALSLSGELLPPKAVSVYAGQVMMITEYGLSNYNFTHETHNA